MATVNCSGIDARTATTGDGPRLDVYLAPGFIDLQVNGFAGVDYNHPRTTHGGDRALAARAVRDAASRGSTRR